VSALEVRRAGPPDVDEIVAMLSEAARWLLFRGIQQWPDPFPRDCVERLVRRGDFYGRRVRPAGVGSQRERGRPTNPTQEGAGALLG